MTLKDVIGDEVKVNNRLDMDNQERFENVAIGYAVQGDRLQSSFQGWVDAKDRAKVDKSVDIMRKIKKEVNWLGKIYPTYRNHLNNSIWCKQKLKKTIKTLKQVIADVDVLVA